MSQGHRRHGGRGSTLLYYIGLEGKEDRRTEEQKKRKRERKTKGQKDKRTEKKGKRNGKQKDRRTEKKINGKEDGRTKEQEKGTETYSYLPFLMPPTSSLFSMVISVFFTEALSLPKR